MFQDVSSYRLRKKSETESNKLNIKINKVMPKINNFKRQQFTDILCAYDIIIKVYEDHKQMTT